MNKAFVFFLTALVLFHSAFGQTAPNAKTPPVQSAPDLAQYGIKIEPDKRLIVVMAALEAGGLELTLAPDGEAFRRTVRADSYKLNQELRGRLKAFVEQYKKRRSIGAQSPTQAEMVAPFVSLAYALSAAPDLADPPNRTELPAAVLDVLDFATLAREFYRTSGIAEKLPAYAAVYQTEGNKMRLSAAKMSVELLDYLHTRPQLAYSEKTKIEAKPEKGKKQPAQKFSVRERERRFYVVPELLAPAGTVNLQNVADDYYAVVPPGTDLSRSDVRRAYLQFVVDPLVLKNAREILPFRDGIKILLDERRKTRADISPDVFLAVSRSLVAAIDAKENEFQKVGAATIAARQKIDRATGDDAKRAVSAELAVYKQTAADETALELSEAYDRGAVLAFYFADRLNGLESSGFDIAGSFKDMIESLDAAKESNRTAQFADARRRAIASRQSSRDKNLELPKRLLEVDALVNNKKYDEADARLKRLLDENPNESRIYYTLGRISSITAETAFDETLRDKRLDDAKAYYTNAIGTANAQKTDPALIQLSYVALGRIYEFYDERETALKMYDAAINLREIAGGAYREAVAAKDSLMKKPREQ